VALSQNMIFQANASIFVQASEPNYTQYWPHNITFPWVITAFSLDEST